MSYGPTTYSLVGSQHYFEGVWTSTCSINEPLCPSKTCVGICQAAISHNPDNNTNNNNNNNNTKHTRLYIVTKVTE